MLKLPSITAIDYKEGLRSVRKAALEEERKKRIFNAHNRLFGLDLDALARQVAEKNKRKQEEIEKKQCYERDLRAQQDARLAMEMAQKARAKSLVDDMMFYRCRFQRKEDRREFDLNDPNIIKHGKPARTSDYDPNLGISSAQVFEGEDLTNADRKLLQRDQLRAWLNQQVAERKAAEEAERKADEVYRATEKCIDDKRAYITAREQDFNYIRIMELQEYNRRLAEIQKRKREQARIDELEDNMAEIYNMVTSDMLTESRDTPINCLNPNKKNAIMYRGPTEEETREFLKDRAHQLSEIRKRKDEAKLMDQQWGRCLKNNAKILMLKADDLESENRERRLAAAEYNKVLAAEQRLRKEIEKKERLSSISDEFYNNFNRTSR